jgi:RES domain-containing protein
VKNRDLLAAIAELETVAIGGEFERHCSLGWDDLKPSAAGGRWGAPRAFEVLYLGRPRDCVVAEAYRHLVDDELDQPAELAAAVIERRILTCAVAVDNLLDLRPAAARASLKLPDADLFSDPGAYERCQAIGAAAHQLRLHGVIAPSATRLGETLALFTHNLPIEQTPAVTHRDIWRGLPADPRRLRAVNDGTNG